MSVGTNKHQKSEVEMIETISSKRVKTRKPHNCWGCTEMFTMGTYMERNTSVDGGQIGTCYFCDSCVAILNALPAEDWNDGWCYGDLSQYYNDYIKVK